MDALGTGRLVEALRAPNGIAGLLVAHDVMQGAIPFAVHALDFLIWHLMLLS